MLRWFGLLGFVLYTPWYLQPPLYCIGFGLVWAGIYNPPPPKKTRTHPVLGALDVSYDAVVVALQEGAAHLTTNVRRVLPALPPPHIQPRPFPATATATAAAATSSNSTIATAAAVAATAGLRPDRLGCSSPRLSRL